MKIALLRVYNQNYYGEADYERWFKEYVTDFAEVSQKEFDALREFVRVYNMKHQSEQRYIIVINESDILPKTIAEALEFAEKQKQQMADAEKKRERQKKEKEKLNKQKATERLEREIAKLEEYKAKLSKIKKGE